AVGAVLLDFATGIISALVQKKGIKSSKLWKTLFKLFFVTLFIMLLYSMDTEFHIIELHRIVAWLIVGFEAWSILENMAKITDHKIFRILKEFMEDKIEKQTGVKIGDDY
ncbi:MAG: phage holin family protein, partial [Tissierellia bacterium]|nr:phage holin family protein [Tissierellia bacterium]